MANIDQLACTVTGAPGNTGYPDCYLDLTQITGGALVPPSFNVPKASLASPAALITYLKTAAQNDDPSSRIYPIQDLFMETAGGGDNRTYTDPRGGIKITGENPYQWLFQFTKGGAYLLSQIRKFNSNGQWNIILWDANNVYMANNGDGSAGGLNLLSNWGNALQPPTGQDPTLYRLFISMTTAQFNDARYAANHGGNIYQVKGLQDITLSLAAAGTAGWDEATGIAKILVKVGAINLYSRYKTQLASPSVWKAYNVDTGNVITITSVTANDALLAFVVDLDQTDTDYPTGVGSVGINLVSTSALATALVVGYESATPLIEPTT